MRQAAGRGGSAAMRPVLFGQSLESLPMRLIFAGTPEFARVALAQLHAAGHDIALVLTSA